jgi:hypothetical protein
MSNPLEIRALSLQQIERFMEVEHPNFPPIGLLLTQPSIGAFYDSIIAGIRNVKPDVDPHAFQIRFPSMPPINSIFDAIAVIERVKREGEGTDVSPEQPLGEADVLAHYYQFKQILLGKRLVKNGSKWEFSGSAIEFPDVHGMTIQSDQKLHLEFRKALCGVLRHMEDCWTLGTPFGVVEMFKLGIEGRRLAQSGILPEFVWLD